jgi:hypothetical protein
MGGFVEVDAAKPKLTVVNRAVKAYLEDQISKGNIAIAEEHKTAFFTMLTEAIEGNKASWEGVAARAAKFGMASAGMAAKAIRSFTDGMPQRVQGIIEAESKEGRLTIHEDYRGTFLSALTDTITQELRKATPARHH